MGTILRSSILMLPHPALLCCWRNSLAQLWQSCQETFSGFSFFQVGLLSDSGRNALTISSHSEQHFALPSRQFRLANGGMDVGQREALTHIRNQYAVPHQLADLPK